MAEKAAAASETIETGTKAAREFIQTLTHEQLNGDEYDSVYDRYGEIEEGLLDAVVDVAIAFQKRLLETVCALELLSLLAVMHTHL